MDIAITRIRPTALLPVYQTPGSAAADLAACLESPVTLKPGERAIIPTGLCMAIPEGYEGQVRARSGLSVTFGVCLANGVGTLDSDYRGEVGVLLLNLGTEPFVVEHGMRVAQLVIARYEQAAWQLAETLPETERGEGGYGSTGH